SACNWPLAAPATSRGGSRSSTRTSHRPPPARAWSQLPNAASREPKCNGPVGEGAKRPVRRECRVVPCSVIALGFRFVPPHLIHQPRQRVVSRTRENTSMFKRVALFLATNLAVLALASVVMSLFGVNAGQFGGLLVFAAIFGFGGSFVSLWMSKWLAKRSTGAHVIEAPRNEVEQWLLQTVQRQAAQAGIGMPEVAIYDAPEINAFATGASRNNALVAVSTGLLRGMDRDQAEAVLAHEVSHVANGDMVTMALLQGVLNTFVIVLARIVGRVVDGYLSGGRDNGGVGIGYFVVVFVLEMVFGFFASMIAMWFSRRREFRA